MKTKTTTAGKTTKVIATLFVACGLIFSSCKKGDTGPAGKDGTNGNANVKSQTSTISAWTWDGSAYILYSNVSVSSLTSDIANTGAVMVYLQTTSGEWAPLARTFAITSTTSQNQRYVYSTGNVKIILQNSDLTQPSSSAVVFKIVCIASSARTANPNVNYADYNEVKNTFNLPD